MAITKEKFEVMIKGLDKDGDGSVSKVASCPANSIHTLHGLSTN